MKNPEKVAQKPLFAWALCVNSAIASFFSLNEVFFSLLCLCVRAFLPPRELFVILSKAPSCQAVSYPKIELS